MTHHFNINWTMFSWQMLFHIMTNNNFLYFIYFYQKRFYEYTVITLICDVTFFKEIII